MINLIHLTVGKKVKKRSLKCIGLCTFNYFWAYKRSLFTGTEQSIAQHHKSVLSNGEALKLSSVNNTPQKP